MQLWRTAPWALAGVAALLAPSASGTVLDGIPLDSRLDALLLGMALPVLLVLDWRVFEQAWARRLAATLLALKLAALSFFTPNGFCSEFRPDKPISETIANIVLDEPAGLLRSWDVRAHWGGGTPKCSAITRRDYDTRARFPAFFVNILANTAPPQRELTMVMRGVVTVDERGTLSFDTGSESEAVLTVDGTVASRVSGGRLDATLDPGAHAIDLRARLGPADWRLLPTWNDRSLWSSALVTLAPPTLADRAAWYVLPSLIAGLVLALIGFWVVSAIRAAPLDVVSLCLVAVAAVAVALCAPMPSLARLAPFALAVTVWSPAGRREPGWHAALWLIGVPWLTFAAVLSWPRLDEFTLFSPGDDWLTYQVSAYRIYLQGYWLEAGEPLFYYQPLYRWVAGGLHIVFGDSSGSETFWDLGGLLVGAVLTFVLCRPWMGAHPALVSAAITLALFTLTSIWHLIGRGLAEISAATFAWIAALLLTRAGVGGIRTVLAGGVFAVLAFYARLNHMVFAASLVVFLLPLSLSAADLRSPRRRLTSVRSRDVIAFAAVLGAGLALLSLRAWFYGGHLNPFAGTSFGLNHTGLAPATLFSVPVWQKVFHSVSAEMIVNEGFDFRGLPVYAGSVASLLAIAQVPWFSRLPLVGSLAVLGALAGALAAHAHGYPGRFSIHLVPLAAATGCIAARAAVRRSPRLVSTACP